MMLEWLFAWLGDADIHLGRVTQGIWLGAAGVLVAAWLRVRGLPAILAWGIGFLPLGTSGSLFYLTDYYQEAQLNVPLLAGLFMIVDSIDRPIQADDYRPWIGAFLLSSCVWIKADGLLLWFAVVVVWLLLLRRSQWRIAMAASVLGAVAWVLPCRLWLAYDGVGLGDFSIAQLWCRDWRGHVEVLLTVSQRLWEIMGAHGGTYAWWWWLLLVVLLLRGVAIWKQRGFRLMLLVSVGFLAVFCASYLCSTLPLDWHMNSLYRMLAMLQPWMLAISGAALASSNTHRKTD